MICSGCSSAIVLSDLPLKCVGFNCARLFHYKCTGLTKATAKMITDNDNLCFKCDECLSNQCCGGQHLTPDMKRIEEEMQKLSSLSDSVIQMRDQIATQINSAINIGMEQLRSNVKESLEKLLCEKFEKLNHSVLQLNTNQNIAAINNARARIGTIPSESDQIGKKRRIEYENNDDVFDDGATFAQVVKSRGKNNKSNSSNKSNTNIGFKPVKPKTRPVIVIKPKESKQPCEETRKFLKTNLDPKTHKVSNFRNGKDGSIIVENIDLVKNGIQSNLGEKYSAVVPTSVPRLKVVGMSENLSPDVFIDYLKSQNDCITINELRILI
ncbi:uncharacterized protein LOC129718670 [Wyeomyia smithii]|uniref:uncharacterized protein LOC129718670 n=1 Tax=Wyeomyia smithii TaxID=174621 RepID=UPI002467B6C7|nr:uncharacterized protein LOC129718670 [Wyeomyia smithii]